ncbi:OmpA family protein [Pseudopedobacter beijingensis]|uniref:OmpA family protein n=1 Tax=Pseudopedobacter beijingensis TaxID=1207056 RepID=A0ABW4IFF1_9SPHI
MKALLTFALISINLVLFAQVNYSTKNRSAIKSFEKAQSLLDLNDFLNAQKELDLAIKQDVKFSEAYHLKADIYRFQGDFLNAKSLYKKAFDIAPELGIDRYFYLAEVELKTGDYNEAIKHFNIFSTKSNLKPEKVILVEKYLKDCDFALNAIKKPVSFTPINLGDAINTVQHEYMPAVTPDEQILIFTRQINNNEDFYSSVKKDGKWQTAQYLSNNINTPEYNEGAQCISSDGQFLFFTGCNRPDGLGRCDIYVSQKEGDNWSKPVNLGSPINTSGWESQPSLSADGRTLYFVSDRKGGYGSYDIWKSTLDENGKWQVPINLGSNVNTPYDEQSPFIHPDNETLYFSSNGWPGMGNKDLFVSRLDSTGNWGKAKNFGYPINTYGEESGLTVNANGTTAFFSSNNFNGKGGFDIYSFDLPSEIRPQSVNYIKGKVYDAKNKKPLNALVEILDLKTGESLYAGYADKINGTFMTILPNKKTYSLNVFDDGYLFFTENFSTEKYPKDKPIYLDVPMNKIAIGEKVVLKNIFFDTNKYDLKDDSKTELGILIDFLNENKNIKIELRGHTDNDGHEKTNQVLSENRAKTVYDYLIEKGVLQKRLQYKGFGESSPIDNNSTPEGKANNRRTEFVIIDILK